MLLPPLTCPPCPCSGLGSAGRATAAPDLPTLPLQWPWERWSWVLDQPASCPQRVFCCELVHRMVRMAYWGKINEVCVCVGGGTGAEGFRGVRLSRESGERA